MIVVLTGTRLLISLRYILMGNSHFTCLYTFHHIGCIVILNKVLNIKVF